MLPASNLPIFGNLRVAIIADDSGSTTPFRAKRDAQIAFVRQNAGIEGDVNLVAGYTFAPAFPPVTALLAAVENPAVDAVYFLSDFAGGDENRNSAETFRTLAEALRRRQVRFYISTFNQPPQAPYAALAGDSGGGVVNLDR
jgi:hypothetical protein